MYKIIGADQKEYGPISAEQVRQWMIEGRLSGKSFVLPEGSTEWKTIDSLPEFAAALGSMGAAPPVGMPPTLSAGPEPLPGGDYSLDIVACVSNAWNLLFSNFGLLFGGCMLFILIQFAIGLLGAIPIIGPLFSIANLVFMGPLTGGLYYLILRVLRRQPASVGDLFAGFKNNIGNLILGYIVMALIMIGCALPGFGIMAAGIIPMVMHQQANAGGIMIAILGFIVAMVPLIYLKVSWFYVIPLIIDKRMDFWPAMKACRSRVGQHWWAVFGLVVVGGLLNIAGELACCVGLLVSIPLVFCAFMYGYETLFSTQTTQNP